MAGVFHKAKLWLGLASDEEYEYYDDDPYRGAPGPQQAPRPGPRPAPRPRAAAPGEPAWEEEPAVQVRSGPAPRPSGSVRPMPATRPETDEVAPTRTQSTPTVRPMRPSSAKPTVLAPVSFEAAKDVADRFKAEQPVVMDLTGADKELSRRLIDFSSGLCYGLGGHMERLAPGTYLLTPSNVEVSEIERARLRGR